MLDYGVGFLIPANLVRVGKNLALRKGDRVILRQETDGRLGVTRVASGGPAGIRVVVPWLADPAFQLEEGQFRKGWVGSADEPNLPPKAYRIVRRMVV